MMTEVRPEQPENALLLMLVTSSLNITSFIDVNPLNQELAVVQCMVTEVKTEQFLNAFSPISVTLLGIEIEVSFVHD